MNTLTTQEIGAEPVPLGREATVLHIYDGLHTPVSDDVLVLSANHKHSIEQFAADALTAYGLPAPEPTRAQGEHGVASLITRVDCTIVNGQLMPYELEDSPSGIGISDVLSKRANGTSLTNVIREHYQATAGVLPHVIVSGSRQHGTDDSLVVGPHNYHYKQGNFAIPTMIKDGDAVIVKAIPGNHQSREPYLSLQSQALSPLVTEGDKNYALTTGLMQEITAPEDLLNNDGELLSQVIKRVVGSMAMGVSIYLSPADRKQYGQKGTVSAGRLRRDAQSFIAADGLALVQPFEPPVRAINPEQRSNVILRMFVLARQAIDQTIDTTVVGGCYVARPELIVHGAGNAVGGAVVLE